MTDEEKLEMRNVDAHARALLERTEALSEADMWRLHGTQREPVSLDEQIFGTNKRLEEVQWHNGTLKSGDRVRISPRGRADVMDLALAGRTAVIESVEQDAEQRIHLALVLDDDPGKDLGLDKQTGHRFFFGLDEVEAIE
jgi:hydrogenase maturation protease